MKKLIVIITLFTTTSILAQRGKDGNKVISASEVVNAYTTLTSDASVGNNSITVANSNLNSNFSGNLTAGDLIMIIQLQGVSIIDMAHPGQNPTWGEITNYNNCGNYEFLEVESVPNGTTINLSCALLNNYTANGTVLIVRVPRYNTLTINAGGVLTTTSWDGTSGGVLAVEVLGATIINTGGSIDVSGLGFRGGTAYNPPTVITGSDRYTDDTRVEGAEKGEGVAGTLTYYQTNYEGMFGRGAAANAGGGANAHNSGGGGGGNAGLNGWNNGVGNPDISNANYITAWNLETGITGLTSTTVSSGGGRGGYSFLSQNRNELTVPPGDASWGSSKREAVGGLGGRPLDYSTGRIFMGGGGGAGDGNNNQAGDGGNAGGLIYIKSYDDISGGGDIISNGIDGGNSFGTASVGQLAGKDGGGGGGAGGTIILQTTSTVSLTGQITANGGNGGNQILTAGLFATIDEGEGPGGSGGGGYIAVSSGTPTRIANGGINGVTNSPYVSNFPPNGATMGGVGLTNETISSFDLIANDETICPNTTATLTATISGIAPVGATIEWYDAEFNGNLLQTGNTFTTPNLAVQTTYYVKTCPGSFTVPVTVFIDVCGVPPIASFSSSDSTICEGSCIDFTDLSSNTPSGWTWYFFGADTPNSSLQNPTNICYSSAGTFNIALVSSNPSGSDSLFIADFITVNALPTIVTSPDTAICIGDSVNLSASGGTTYFWNNGLGNGANHIDNPTSNTTYTVYVTDTNLCLDSAQVNVTINSLPAIIASNDTTICTGDAVNLSASGGVSYLWDNSLGAGATHNPTPIVNTNYNVVGTDLNGCSNTDQVIVTVGVCGVAPISEYSASDSTICLNECVNFTDLSQNLPTSWTWYFFGADTPNSTSQNPTNICYSSVGSFDVALVTTNTNGTDSLFIANFISVNNLPTITTNSDTAVCNGSSINLFANGAVSYIWDNGLGLGQTHTAFPTIPTTYSVIGTDVNGCSNNASVNVAINSLPIIVLSPDTSVCLGDTLNLRGISNLSYVWDNGLGAGANHDVFPTVNTTYTSIGTDANGCSNSDQVNVTILSLPNVIASANNTTICNGDTVNLTASGANIYSWDNGISPNPTVNPNAIATPSITTTYTVTAANTNGCINTSQVTVNVISCMPVVSNLSASDTSICITNCISFTDLSTNAPTNWTWYFFGSDTPTENSQNPTNICYSSVGTFDVALVASNAFGGDSLFLSNYITVDSCIIPEELIPVVVIPNVFSPNGDSQNDLFKVSGVGILNVSINVFNRWGQKVYNTNQLNDGWDGRTNSGTEVPEGTYYFVIDITTTTNTETKTGYLTLIR